MLVVGVLDEVLVEQQLCFVVLPYINTISEWHLLRGKHS